MKRGISLLEVLISIGVLAVGLLSVAALIPAGHHQISQGSRLDYASMIGRASLRDLQIRGYLDPSIWKTGAGNLVWQPSPLTPAAKKPPERPPTPLPYWPPYTYDNGTTHGLQLAVVMDPLGIAAGYGNTFPTGASAPFLTRIAPINMSATGAPEFMDTVFRSSADLTTTENTNRDLPPTQFWFGAAARRASEGSYTWLATIVSDPTALALSNKVTVSVAVFHKRDLSAAGVGESFGTAVVSSGTASGLGIGGGDLVLFGSFTPVRPGQWIMLAGRAVPQNLDYFGWFRVVSAGNATGTGSIQQNVTLAGRDWQKNLINAGSSFTNAFIIDNIVAVYEKNMVLMGPFPYTVGPYIPLP